MTTAPPDVDDLVMPSEDSHIPKRKPLQHPYFTPPDNMADSFSHEEEPKTQEEWEKQVQQSTLAPMQMYSPPASPRSSTLPSISSATGYVAHDAPLYSDAATRTERARSQTPLFASDRPQTPPLPASTTLPAHAASSSQVSQLPAVQARAVSAKPLPRPQSFPAILGIDSVQAAREYYFDRLAEERRRRMLRMPEPKRWLIAERDYESRRQLSNLRPDLLTRPAAVRKSRPTPKVAAKTKAAKAASPDARTPPAKRRAPKARTVSDFVDNAWPPSQPVIKHKRAPPSKKVEGENVNWNELPDYSPPVDTLDRPGAKPLKANWKGHPLDLSTDEDRALCHPQEIEVAANLRLSIGQYLSNKRKIFQARLQSVKDGKNFTKTAAQGACSIDVNKASQLWEAFEKVGWFDERHFEKWL